MVWVIAFGTPLGIFWSSEESSVSWPLSSSLIKEMPNQENANSKKKLGRWDSDGSTSTEKPQQERSLGKERRILRLFFNLKSAKWECRFIFPQEENPQQRN